ncbi:MAG: hypothetical protein Kow00121_12710 [Elainellaceae cyanobacterium]
MQFKFYSRLRASLLLSAGFSLGLMTLIPIAEARIISNGTFSNGTVLNGMTLKSGSTPQLQLEGSQLVLHLNR